MQKKLQLQKVIKEQSCGSEDSSRIYCNVVHEYKLFVGVDVVE